MDQRHRIAVADWIEFEEEQHQVTGITGALVRLRSASGHHQTIMLSTLLADASFRTRTVPIPEAANTAAGLDPGGVLALLPKEVREAALTLEAHMKETTTGYRSGDELNAQAGEPRPAYQPDLPLTARVEAKAAELGLTPRRIWQLLDEWQENGLWALVDRRKARLKNPLRNIDERVITAIREQAAAERHDSSSSVSTRFRRRTQNRLDEDHGPGTVLLPKEDTFRRIVKLLLARSPSAPAYQRISDANQPDRTFGNVIAHRPCQVVMLDTTPLDVLAFDPATNDTYNVELTLALDVATRSILAWRLTPLGTKAIDIGLLLADVMTPEPMRPDWADALRYQMLRVPFERHLTVDERLAEAAARPVIHPETLLYDHGKPYKSDVVQRACRKWKIDMQDARKLKPTDKNRLIDYTPVVYLNIPSQATPKDLSVALAEYLAQPYRSGATKSDITRLVLENMRLVGVELVIIDDAHFMDLSFKEGKVVNDHLKYIANHTAATFIYTGVDLKHSGLFLEGSGSARVTQTAGRNTLLHMTPYSIKSRDEKADWTSVIAAMEDALVLYRHQPGTLAGEWKYLYRRTGGNISSLAELIREAAVDAVLTGAERIDRRLLDSIVINEHAQSTYETTWQEDPEPPATEDGPEAEAG
ncbi:TniB family NTP-binding protein [Streptomyces alanosinicus]|uniref:Transposase n=1 Tax=Streptomyces alanosinicus TaxID=68171 RepID=A0A918YN37_9ACTN|nr:TniB family NTP-binding protein [Streptomyces alanosinicus]GHE08764.1 hypothetical protein GCM10010339_58810 [Streptomyces alanosinicus]